MDEEERDIIYDNEYSMDEDPEDMLISDKKIFPKVSVDGHVEEVLASLDAIQN